MGKLMVRRIAAACVVQALVAGAFVEACSSDGTPTLAATDAGGGTDTSVRDQSSGGDTGNGGDTSTAPAHARATIQPTTGAAAIVGVADFVEGANGEVTATVSVTQAPPGLHGLHVHVNPDCGDAGLAAGGHWNPLDASHGYPDSAVHHPGDMGNIAVNEAGVGNATVTLMQGVTVAPGTMSVIGHSVIVHTGIDDGVSQPTGDAGARIGCGIIAKY